MAELISEEYSQLESMVMGVKGTTFGGITTKTEVKLRGGKKNPMQGRVTKITEDANVIFFANTDKSGYAEMVKRRMVAEGKDPEDFKVGPRPWGVRLGKSPFISHKDKYYLECIFVSPGKSSYFLDGKPIPKEEIEGLPESKPETQSEKESQGGIEEKVILRTFKLDSILQIKMNGTVWKNSETT